MSLKKLLFIPADAITNEISRSFYLAKGLSESYDVYMLFWEDVQNSDFQNLKGNKLYTLKCFFKSLFTKIQIYNHVKYNYKIIVAPRILTMLLYRVIGHVLALKLVRFFNKRILKKIAKRVNPDVYFYADGFDNYPIIDKKKIILSDIQDDFSEGNFRDNTYQQKYGERNFNDTVRNFIVTKAAAERLGKYYNATFEFLPNGADFTALRAINSEEIYQLKTTLALQNKTIVTYIGGRAWMDNSLALELFNKALIEIPDVHFIIIGNHKKIECPNVTYTGAIPNDETYKYFNLSDVGILLKDSRNSPFLENSMPLKIIQYSAINKPVLVPKLSWIEDEKFGNVKIIENFNATTIIDYLKNYQNIESTFDKKWDQYNWPIILKKITDLINSTY